jgi:hypothetical protein
MNSVSRAKDLGRVMPKTLHTEMISAITDLAKSFNFCATLPPVGYSRCVKPDMWEVQVMVVLVQAVDKGYYVTYYAEGLGYQCEPWRISRTYVYRLNDDRTYSIKGETT